MLFSMYASTWMPCVHMHPPALQELDLHFSSETNGLFVKRRPAVSNRKHSAPAISSHGEGVSLHSVCPSVLKCWGFPMEGKSSINPR